METTITLTGKLADLFRTDAQREGVPVDVLAARRLEENVLLWRIHTAAPEDETRELHRLLRRQKIGTLTEKEREQLLALIESRELLAAQRLEDLGALAHLRGLPVRELMNQLGIRFTVDHIQPVDGRGATTRVADPETGVLVPLFNPRTAIRRFHEVLVETKGEPSCGSYSQQEAILNC
jgi:hypothetical protein